MTSFANLTTIGVGGEIAQFYEPQTSDELVNLLQTLAKTQTEYKIIGGGCNILPSDGDYQNYAVIRFFDNANPKLDDFVQENLALAPLSGIPGTLCGAIVQNAGAYGSEISDYITAVQVWDTKIAETVKLPHNECGFTYRNSIFKHNSRYIVLGATFNFDTSATEVTVKHAQLANALNCSINEVISGETVRQKVLELRRSKGMLANTDISATHTYDPDQVSCGSFFTNPVISHNDTHNLPENCPTYAIAGDTEHIKCSAAFLIESAGFSKGYTISEQSCARLSNKHVLALVNKCTPQNCGYAGTTQNIYSDSKPCNHSAAPGADIRELAEQIQKTIYSKYNIKLSPEPVFL